VLVCHTILTACMHACEYKAVYKRGIYRENKNRRRDRGLLYMPALSMFKNQVLKYTPLRQAGKRI